jgi:hypothetical protein
LGFDFAVRASSEPVGRYLHDLLGAFEVHDGPAHMYSFVERGTTNGVRYDVYRHREPVSVGASAGTALRHLLWDVNRMVVQSTPGLLLVHASSVEHEGRAVVFPGRMGSGKTTLVAGLLQRGLRYLTDEAVAIDPTTLRVRPYPKPLSIDSGSRGVLSALRPDLPPSMEPFLDSGWYVPPQAIAEDVVGQPSVPSVVMALEYRRDAFTECTEVRRSEALITLAENSFNITGFGAQRAMHMLARVVRSSRCYRLTVGNLADACAIVFDVLATQPLEVAT